MFDLLSTLLSLKTLRPPIFVLWRYVVRSLMPRFTDVVFLPRVNPKVLSHPFHILKPDVVILAQRKSDPVFRKQDALQIRVIRILHADYVIHPSLDPSRTIP